MKKAQQGSHRHILDQFDHESEALERAALECISHVNDHSVSFKTKLLKLQRQTGKKIKQANKSGFDFMEVAQDIEKRDSGKDIKSKTLDDSANEIGSQQTMELHSCLLDSKLAAVNFSFCNIIQTTSDDDYADRKL